MRRFGPVRRGEPIRAAYLTAVSETLNDLQQAQAAETVERQALTDAARSNLDERQLGDPVAQREHPEIEAQPGGAGYLEQARTTETVRVENPDDAEQYVDVARIATVTLKKVSGDGPAFLTLKFDT